MCMFCFLLFPIIEFIYHPKYEKKKNPSFSLIFRTMLRNFLSSAKEFHQIINENDFFCGLEVKQAPTTSTQWYITRHQVV